MIRWGHNQRVRNQGVVSKTASWRKWCLRGASKGEVNPRTCIEARRPAFRWRTTSSCLPEHARKHLQETDWRDDTRGHEAVTEDTASRNLGFISQESRKVLMSRSSDTSLWNATEDRFKRGGVKGNDQKTRGFSRFFTENCKRKSKLCLRKDANACPAGDLAVALM